MAQSMYTYIALTVRLFPQVYNYIYRTPEVFWFFRACFLYSSEFRRTRNTNRLVEKLILPYIWPIRYISIRNYDTLTQTPSSDRVHFQSVPSVYVDEQSSRTYNRAECEILTRLAGLFLDFRRMSKRRFSHFIKIVFAKDNYVRKTVTQRTRLHTRRISIHANGMAGVNCFALIYPSLINTKSSVTC